MAGPWPVADVLHVRVNLQSATRVRGYWYDMNGRLLRSAEPVTLPQGESLVQFSTADMLSGTYLFRILVNGRTVTERIVKY